MPFLDIARLDYFTRRGYTFGMDIDLHAHAARFWSHVERRGPNDCWPWTAGTNGRGYGTLSVGGRGSRLRYGAHRFAFVLENGDVPAGLVIRHRCDNPACCNPAHLEPGTQAENLRDCAQRGRALNARGERAGKAKLTTAAVREIRRRDAAGEKHPSIARDYGVAVSSIWSIARRKHWAHVPD